MPTPALDREVHEQILAMMGRKPRPTMAQIADECGVSVGTVSRWAKVPLAQREEDRIDRFAKHHKERFDELLGRYKKWIGDTNPLRPPKAKSNKRKKNLVLNDIHAPFHNEEALLCALRTHADADECWVAGDVLDLFCVSRYPKSRQDFSLVEEFQSGQAVIRLLAETFPVVRVLHGNHDERYLKFLVAKNIPPDVLEFMRMAYPHALSPLAKICADYPNVHMMEPKTVDFATFSFVHQLGDCVLSHAEKYSKLPSRAAHDVVHWLMNSGRTMGIVKDFRLVIQAHTHQGAKVWTDFGIVAIEAGCLARVPDYAGNPKLMGARPGVLGYTVVIQENGISDINNSHFYQISL
jgi:hypothetical protein